VSDWPSGVQAGGDGLAAASSAPFLVDCVSHKENRKTAKRGWPRKCDQCSTVALSSSVGSEFVDLAG